MSDMEHNKGKLVPFVLTEEIAKAFVEDMGESLSESYATYTEQVEDDAGWYDSSLCKINGSWYKAHFEIEGGELYDFADVVANEDGTIDFNTYHYNGGGHWTEVVEHALNKGESK